MLAILLWRLFEIWTVVLLRAKKEAIAPPHGGGSAAGGPPAPICKGSSGHREKQGAALRQWIPLRLRRLFPHFFIKAVPPKTQTASHAEGRKDDTAVGGTTPPRLPILVNS